LLHFMKTSAYEDFQLQEQTDLFIYVCKLDLTRDVF
jgi:hypothetical protein